MPWVLSPRPIYGTCLFDAGASPPAPPKARRQPSSAWFSPRAPLSRLFAPGECGSTYSAGTPVGLTHTESRTPLDPTDDGTGSLWPMLSSQGLNRRCGALVTPFERLRPFIINQSPDLIPNRLTSNSVTANPNPQPPQRSALLGAASIVRYEQFQYGTKKR